MQAQKDGKRIEQLEKKLANQKLLEEEEKTLKGGATKEASVTRAQIEETTVHSTYHTSPD